MDQEPLSGTIDGLIEDTMSNFKFGKDSTKDKFRKYVRQAMTVLLHQERFRQHGIIEEAFRAEREKLDRRGAKDPTARQLTTVADIPRR